MGTVPYIVACIFAREILEYVLHQPSLMIEDAYNAILCLIPYCLSYVVFAMMRKSLLQYLNSSLLVGIMFVRLCLHVMLGYFLYEYYSESLKFYCFAISDSVSMVVLLLITMFTLTKFVNFRHFIQSLFCIYGSSSSSGGYKRIMNPRSSSGHGNSAGLDSDDRGDGDGINTINNSNRNNRNVNDRSGSGPASGPGAGDSLKLLKEYVSAMIIPGMISCLEWWAIESITWMVGAMSHTDGISVYIYYFVHGMYSSLLLFFQMPILGLSVAMAAIITGDIRMGRFKSAFYTFMQGLVSCLAYCVIVAFVVLIFYNKGLLGGIFNLPNENDIINNDKYSSEYRTFIFNIYDTAQGINLFFIISIVCYSVGMCLLSLFVSVGRLTHGGAFMLMGYLLFGVLVSAICGYRLNWHLYGIWFGYACGFVVWSLLSCSYWMCFSKWQKEMETTKSMYDQIDSYEQTTKMFKANLKNKHLNQNYGTM